MTTVSDINLPDNPAYTIDDVRFELEPGGYATIWFDLGGTAFAEPEAMANMFVELDVFLEDLAEQQPVLYKTLSGSTQAHGPWLDRLDAADFDWDEQLRFYIDRRLDLRAAEKERLPWLYDRRARATGPAAEQFETDWQRLSDQAEPTLQPSWDDVAHALIAGLNDTAEKLYPELLDYNAEDSNRLREMFESHGERLANQLFALTKSVRNGREVK